MRVRLRERERERENNPFLSLFNAKVRHQIPRLINQMAISKDVYKMETILLFCCKHFRKPKISMKMNTANE